MLLREFVIVERNILNMDYVDRVVSSVAEKADSMDIRKWFSTTFRKWLINKFEGVRAVTSWTGKDEKPEWFDRAASQGDLYEIMPLDQDHIHQFSKLLKALNDGVFNGKNLSRISVPQALQFIQDREQEMERSGQLAKGRQEGERVYDFEDGWYIQKLTTVSSLEHEGRAMDHCVGEEKNGHPCKLRDGESQYFSLRDRNGKSYVTIEVDRFREVTSQGRSNHDPKPEYMIMVDEFLRHIGVGKRIYFCEILGTLMAEDKIKMAKVLDVFMEYGLFGYNPRGESESKSPFIKETDTRYHIDAIAVGEKGRPLILQNDFHDKEDIEEQVWHAMEKALEKHNMKYEDDVWFSKLKVIAINPSDLEGYE